jgi:hypothetical protein
MLATSSNGGAATPRPVAQTPGGAGAAATPATAPRGSDDGAGPLRIPFRALQRQGSWLRGTLPMIKPIQLCGFRRSSRQRGVSRDPTAPHPLTASHPLHAPGLRSVLSARGTLQGVRRLAEARALPAPALQVLWTIFARSTVHQTSKRGHGIVSGTVCFRVHGGRNTPLKSSACNKWRSSRPNSEKSDL